MEDLRHEILEKTHAIQENQQEFEKKCESVQVTKRFSHLSLKATKLFESTRSQVTWYFEGSELASTEVKINALLRNFCFFVFERLTSRIMQNTDDSLKMKIAYWAAFHVLDVFDAFLKVF